MKKADNLLVPPIIAHIFIKGLMLLQSVWGLPLGKALKLTFRFQFFEKTGHDRIFRVEMPFL